MRTKAVKDYIKRHQELFWYSPREKSNTVSDELLLETMINYGSLEDIRELFNLLGLENAAAIFRGMTGRKALNIYPELRNYFKLFFDKYVPQHS